MKRKVWRLHCREAERAGCQRLLLLCALICSATTINIPFTTSCWIRLKVGFQGASRLPLSVLQP